MGSKLKKKLIISLILTFILILPTISQSQQKQRIRVVAQNASVRLQPNSESEVILSPPVGSTFEVEQKIGDWYEIKFSSEIGVLITGYINSQFVEVIEAEPPPIKKVIQKPEPQREITRRPAKKLGLKLKAAGGYGTMRIGDYHVWGEDAQMYMDDLIVAAERFGWSANQEGEFEKIGQGMEFESEGILKFGSIGLGGGIGLLRRGKFSELSINIPDTTETIGGSIDPTVSIYSLFGNFYLFIPTTAPVEFYLYGGAAYYHGKMSATIAEYYQWSTWQYSYRETADVEATSSAIGFHAGAGLEIDLSPNIAFFIEGKARFAKLKAWEGTYDYEEVEQDPLFVGSGGYTYSESGEGNLYIYEEEDGITLEYYSQIGMSDTEPRGIGIRNVEEFIFDLTGVSLRVGLVIKF
jgi:opacity protein-like surface antigen